jgi:hypothetical protein
MSRQHRHWRILRRPAPVLAAAALALLAAASGCGGSDGSSSSTSADDAQSWCALVIDINTKHGRMVDRRYLPEDQVAPGTWKGLVDAVVADRDELLAVTPSSIEEAQANGLDWFVRARDNAYSRSTPLGSFTLADRDQLVDFQKAECGIRFSD